MNNLVGNVQVFNYAKQKPPGCKKSKAKLEAPVMLFYMQLKV